MKIGIVDLDTSHPAAWIPIERELGHEIVGIWDGGSVHPADYAQRFASEHGVPRVYNTLDEMTSDVDCAIIHGCDWDTHLPKAHSFLEAGKAVLLDKPMAGNIADLNELVRLSSSGARIIGGSSLRFCYETAEFLMIPETERGVPHTVFCGCAVDEFNYGIHAYSLLRGIIGSGADSVRHLRSGPQRRIQINWPDGRTGIIAIGATSKWLPFYATIVTDKMVHQFTVNITTVYRSLLEVALPYLAGETPTQPLSMESLIEPELCALAAKLSWEQGDREVSLAELDGSDVSYDGRAFAAKYRRQRYPETG